MFCLSKSTQAATLLFPTSSHRSRCPTRSRALCLQDAGKSTVFVIVQTWPLRDAPTSVSALEDVRDALSRVGASMATTDCTKEGVLNYLQQFPALARIIRISSQMWWGDIRLSRDAPHISQVRCRRLLRGRLPSWHLLHPESCNKTLQYYYLV